VNDHTNLVFVGTLEMGKCLNLKCPYFRNFVFLIILTPQLGFSKTIACQSVSNEIVLHLADDGALIQSATAKLKGLKKIKLKCEAPTMKESQRLVTVCKDRSLLNGLPTHALYIFKGDFTYVQSMTTVHIFKVDTNGNESFTGAVLPCKG